MASPPYDLIREKLQLGEVIPFLGAAASLAGRPTDHEWTEQSVYPPTGTDLAQYFAKRVELLDPKVETDLAKVAQFYESIQAGRKPLHDDLFKLLGRPFSTGSIHELLASISAPLLIVTTNYDELIESAFRKASKSFDVVVHTTDPAFGERVLWRPHGAREAKVVVPNRLDIDLSTTTVIYKMHGSISSGSFQDGQYVITEDDYVEFLVRMAKGKAIPAIFAEHFTRHPFLFLGYGLRDWNFRVVLGRLKKQLSTYHSSKSWAIQLNPSELECELWKSRGVQIYSLSIDDFVSKISARGRPAP